MRREYREIYSRDVHFEYPKLSANERIVSVQFMEFGRVICTIEKIIPFRSRIYKKK